MNSNGKVSNLNGNSTGGNGNSSPNNNRKFQGNNCGLKGHEKGDCWLNEKNAHKHQKNWKWREVRNKANARNVEQLLARVDIEENSVFELCGCLINDWKEAVKGSNANGPSNTHEDN